MKPKEAVFIVGEAVFLNVIENAPSLL